MLERLEISNFALIDKTVLMPGQGVTVITGETGAGKSILIDAITALTGKRSKRESVGSYGDTALIEASFEIDGEILPESILKDLPHDGDYSAYDGEDETDAETVRRLEVILSREIRNDGKSFARVNGRLCTAGFLRELSSKIIAVHGQNKEEEIFQPEKQLELVDTYGGKKLQDKAAEYLASFNKLKAIKKELKKAGISPEEREREADILAYQINEIEEADFSEGDEEQLTRRSRQLAALSKINEELQRALYLLYGAEEASISANMALLIEALDFPLRFSKDIEKIQNSFVEHASAISELGSELEAFLERVKSEPGEAEEVAARLDLLHDLKMKYGKSIDDILKFRDDASVKLDKLKKSEEYFQSLNGELDHLLKEIECLSIELHELRQAAAEKLSNAVQKNLRALNMPNAEFIIDLKLRDHSEKAAYKINGRDQVEFLFTANPGSAAQPVSKVASGGEAARLILAIKAVLADSEKIPTLIFDEIDSGVSGKTAAVLAEKMRELSKGRQVLCVSHTAQTAAAADNQILIEKKVEKTSDQGLKTVSNLLYLDGEGRISEVARLLSGNPADKKSRDLAKEMINKAR